MRATSPLSLLLLSPLFVGCDLGPRAARVLLPEVRLYARGAPRALRAGVELRWRSAGLVPATALTAGATPRPLELAGRPACRDLRLCAWERRAVAQALANRGRGR